MISCSNQNQVKRGVEGEPTITSLEYLNRQDLQNIKLITVSKCEKLDRLWDEINDSEKVYGKIVPNEVLYFIFSSSDTIKVSINNKIFVLKGKYFRLKDSTRDILESFNYGKNEDFDKIRMQLIETR
jgi:hypothetical protein